MFRYGGYSDLLHPNYLFPGGYVVQGCYNQALTTANTVENYLFTAAAETALAASDFVIIHASGSNTGIIGVDSQGDAGGGTQTTTTGAFAVGDCPMFCFVGEPLILPSSWFKASQSTRTGTVVGTVSTQAISFTFCSYPSAPASDQYYPANYTINGHWNVNQITNTEGNYLFDTTADGYLASSDFVMVNSETTSGTATCIIFDTQGDGGSGSLSLGDVDNTAGAVIWKVSGNSPICLPASIFPSGQSTRTGRLLNQTSTGSRGIVFTFCSWN